MHCSVNRKLQKQRWHWDQMYTTYYEAIKIITLCKLIHQNGGCNSKHANQFVNSTKADKKTPVMSLIATGH